MSDSDEPVTFVHTNLTNLAVQARLQLTAGMARLSLRQSEAGSYTALLDATGTLSLYRGGQRLGTATVTPTAPGQWRSLRLSAIDSVVRVAVDGVEALALLDATPLPAGTISFAGIGLGANTLLVDDVGVWILTTELLQPTATPAVTLTPTNPPFLMVTPPGQNRLSMGIMALDLNKNYVVVDTLAELNEVIAAVESTSRVLPNPYHIYIKPNTDQNNTNYDVARIYIPQGRHIKIYGVGSALTILRANSAETLFQVDSQSKLELYDLTITNIASSHPAYGGAMNNYGEAEISSVVFQGNIAVNGGGAISNNGNLEITNSVFVSNQAGGGRAIQSQITAAMACIGFYTGRPMAPAWPSPPPVLAAIRSI